MNEQGKRHVASIVRWVLVVASLVLAVGAWWSYHASGGSAGVSTSQAKYQCPMHPGIVSATPGTCPICGMDLVPIEKDRAAATTAAPTSSASFPYVLEDAGAATIGDGGAARYACPMHPEVRTHDPGSCPICKMRLEPIPSEGQARAPHGLAPVTLTEGRMQSIGVRFATAKEEEAGGTVRLTASIAAPEQGASEVHVRTPGFVERIAVRETGTKVAAGQELVAVYSPEVFQAQVELLAARSIGGAAFPSMLDAGAAGGDRVSSAARTRLELLGVNGRAIDEVLRTGQPARAVSVVAPAGGFVTKKNVVLGSYVTPETTLYEIVDLSKVYVVADVFAVSAGDVTVGTRAKFSVSGRPELTETGAIDLVYPRANPEARTTRVRMPLPNAGMRFVPGQPGTLEVETAKRKALFVPRDAVVDTGAERYVFVDGGGGALTPRSVATGASQGDSIEITRGLSAGERVVSGATFLVDSESRLRAGMGGGAP